jgi:DNA-binding GntR family transcriptional regulator
MEYEPGKVLNEKELAKEFGISRTPVREAILKLEWEKLVEIIPRGGVFVSKIEFQTLRDIFHFRVYIEALIARRAANNITGKHLHEIRKLKKGIEDKKSSSDPKSLIKPEFFKIESLTPDEALYNVEGGVMTFETDNRLNFNHR